ncbi:MAG: Permease of the drug/metabolite transporter superfamily [Phycisphaerales bacterium]|nr:Permease of the drug/metabolite transporter superfamily [Phycisphaerales bacterium]
MVRIDEKEPIEAPVTVVSPLPAIGVLVLCCALWGYSFPVMQFATRAFDRHLLGGGAAVGDWQKFASRALFNGIRFGLAAILYGAVTWRRQRRFSRHDVVGGAVVGTFFAMGMLLQVTGLLWVFPSVSSFFTALPVVFAPVAQALFLKGPVGRATWMAVGLAVVGIVLLSWPKPQAAAEHSQISTPPIPYLGEMLTIAGAAVFTAEIICVHHFGQSADAVRLTFVMLITTAVLSGLAGVVLGGGSMVQAGALAGLVRDHEAAWTMATLVAFSSVMALHLMNTYQPRVSPAIASVVYCTEPLFGTLFSLLFATEHLTRPTIAGGLVVIVSVLMVATAGPDPKLAAEGHLGQ